MTVLCAGRHLARTAVSGWVILAAVALAISLTLVVEWFRARWKQQNARRDAEWFRELDREFSRDGGDRDEIGYDGVREDGGPDDGDRAGHHSLLDAMLDRRRGDRP